MGRISSQASGAEENLDEWYDREGMRSVWNSSVIKPIEAANSCCGISPPGLAGRGANPAGGTTVITDTMIQSHASRTVEDRTVTRANEILTERLLLRPPTLADAEQIFSRYGQ